MSFDSEIPARAAARRRATELLGEDGVEAEVRDATPAVLLRDGEAEQPVLRRLAEQPPVDLAVALPRPRVRLDVLGDEATDGLPEGLVLLVVERLDAHPIASTSVCLRVRRRGAAPVAVCRPALGNGTRCKQVFTP